MFKKIVIRTIAIISGAFIGLIFYGCPIADIAPAGSLPTQTAPVVTVSPAPTPTLPPAYTAEKEAIIKSADRLIQLQNANGSWDWDVTGHDGPTGITYLNIAGVTGAGLLNAYDISGNTKYLDAAKKTGDYLIMQIGNPVDILKKTNSSCVLFLYHLYEASGDSQYLTQANAIMSNILYEDNHWAHNYGNHALDDAVNGCTAGELFLAAMVYRNAESALNGIIAWDLYQYIEAAKNIGDTVFANALAGLQKQYVEQTGFDAAVSIYILGLSAGISGMKKAGLNYASTLNKLLAAQKTDGSWEDNNGVVQNTAYAVMALSDAGEMGAAEQGVRFLMAYQQTNGGWLENDGKEYSEVDSEIIQAIGAYIRK